MRRQDPKKEKRWVWRKHPPTREHNPKNETAKNRLSQRKTLTRNRLSWKKLTRQHLFNNDLVQTEPAEPKKRDKLEGLRRQIVMRLAYVKTRTCSRPNDRDLLEPVPALMTGICFEFWRNYQVPRVDYMWCLNSQYTACETTKKLTPTSNKVKSKRKRRELSTCATKYVNKMKHSVTLDFN